MPLWKEGALLNEPKDLWDQLDFQPQEEGVGGFLPFFLMVFWTSIQFEFTHVKWDNGQMGFANVRSQNILRGNNHR